MTIPFIVFIGVLIIILGAYSFFVARPEQQEQRKLTQRLKGTSKARQVRSVLIKEAERLSSLGAFEAALARIGSVVAPIQLLIEQSGLKLSVASFLLMIGCAGAAGFLIGNVLVGRVAVGLVLGAVLSLMPIAWVRRARTKRLWKFEEQFPEAIDLVSRALRAGHTFQSGLSMVADELTAPVGPEFRLLFDRQNFGMPISEALRSFAERMPVLDAKFFVTAVLTQRDAGGNLAEVLDNLASVIRERFKVKRQVRVISAHGRITGWVLAGLPPVMAVAFMLVSPKHMQTLFNDPIGQQLIILALVLQVVGTLVIRKIVDIEYLKEGMHMSIEMLLTLGAVFLSVGLAAGSVTSLIVSNGSLGRRRLRTITGDKAPELIKTGGKLTDSVNPAFQRLAKFIPKSPKEMSRVQRRMALAGYHGMTPAVIFTAIELLMPVLFGGAVFMFGPAGIARVMLAAFSAAVAYLIPGLVLQRQVMLRKKVIQNGLPDALDLFIVCIEAGSSLDQAILKTSQDLDVPYPPLAEELRMITTEMRAGKPRLEAFKNFASRSGVDDVRALVSMLVQSDRFGTSIAQALRTHAETARTKRRQRAEERAGKIGVKLVFPLVFCLFPAFYVVTLGPGALQFYRFFTQANLVK